MCAEVRDLYARFLIVEKQREEILNEADAQGYYDGNPDAPAYQTIQPVNFEFWNLVKSLNQKCDLLRSMLDTSQAIWTTEHQTIRETLEMIEDLPEMHL